MSALMYIFMFVLIDLCTWMQEEGWETHRARWQVFLECSACYTSVGIWTVVLMIVQKGLWTMKAPLQT